MNLISGTKCLIKTSEGKKYARINAYDHKSKKYQCVWHSDNKDRVCDKWLSIHEIDLNIGLSSLSSSFQDEENMFLNKQSASSTSMSLSSSSAAR